ncbi:hypothetical protein [uncultured Paraglaciecola sp.]|jgi:hypothetical protein|uniref:hypothetical protein n=1 Tax=uncultured Paraglaciecola sp. TaxID=1765024 RepID=UPI002600B30A|nr:hypothetical protein [uncultured Paraglaciecola sp.]
MSTIIGQTIIFALEEAINRQKQINQTLLNSNLYDQTKTMLNEQTKLLIEMLSLCKRVY